jgi:ParB family chromosome partitioning protein
MAEKKPRKRRATGTPRRRRKRSGVSTGLTSSELQNGSVPPDVVELQERIANDAGKVLATYREPFAGRWLILAALPIDKVEPTPYQRNLSESHLRRLETVIGKLGRFLDPVIAVRSQEDGSGKYLTPNGNHRLSAMRTLGAKSIVALVVPETSVAFQILALNTEKAHNLRDKALEVIRMYRELASLGEAAEETYALEFEEPAFITLGLCYEERPRFSGGAYNPVLKRTDQFLPGPMSTAIETRRKRAKALLSLDDKVVEQVEALKARGLTSPYLKSFVVARINPIRFRPKDAEPLAFEEVLNRMELALAKFKPDKIKVEDLARTGGVMEETP